MDQQVFRSKRVNTRCNLEQGDTMSLDCRLANMNVSSSVDICDGSNISLNHSSPLSRKSFDHIVASNNMSPFILDRERDLQEIKKLSLSISREYFREIADSRDPEDDKHCESRLELDERTDVVTSLTSCRNSQDSFVSPTARLQTGSFESSANDLWGSMNCLKRANPIYEDYEEKDEFSYSNSMRKRRCSEERVTTALYWHDELKTADE